MLKTPKWHRDLEVFQKIKSTFIFEGNVHDSQLWVDEAQQTVSCRPLNDYLYDYLKEKGYQIIVFYNIVDGFFNCRSNKDLQAFLKLVNLRSPKIAPNDSGEEPVSAESSYIRQALLQGEQSVAVIYDLANVAVTPPDQLSPDIKDVLIKLLLASKQPVSAPGDVDNRFLYNSIYFITEKANDLPAWFYLHNPYIKTITITRSDKELRKGVFRASLHCFHDAHELSSEDTERILEKFANLTDGFSTADLYGFLEICEAGRFSVYEPKKAVDYFKFGQTESKWDNLAIKDIDEIATQLRKRVIGQDVAIRAASEIIARARLALTGIQKGAGTRPKGILFFAGPTGTGKTELAKSIAELVLGDDSFITRFDMSEYGQPHSDQRLLGAPPGYVGYDAGGQLTNAVKENPFNILLFDEIDKAHPTILDKFLQILDDGRMTDSFGETVYFSESLIIFTSNLGMTKEIAPDVRVPNVTVEEDDYASVDKKIREAIKAFFTKIQRPELLNRIGSNIVVFDFIRDDAVMRQIINLQLSKVKRNLFEERKICLEIDDKYIEQLMVEIKANVENGARGISNKIEEYLVNLLPYVFAEHDIEGDCRIVIHQMENKRLVVDVSALNNEEE